MRLIAIPCLALALCAGCASGGGVDGHKVRAGFCAAVQAASALVCGEGAPIEAFTSGDESEEDDRGEE